MLMSRGRIALVIAACALAVPVLAQAPTALSIIVNGVPLEGKALMYKGRVYVPLEDVAHATGGSYSFDPKTGVVEAVVATPGRAQAPDPNANRQPLHSRTPFRPVLEVSEAQKYISPSNARVVARVTNQGEVPAQKVEAVCTFKDGDRRQIGVSVRPLGLLQPGETRVVDFHLYENGNGEQSAQSGATVPEDKILLYGHWTRVSYDIQLNYAGAKTIPAHT
jgi:hypothetical protein